MSTGLFVTGTDTDVGKTWVTGALAAAIHRRLGSEERKQKLRLWKPVQSGVRMGEAQADSYRLVHGSGLQQKESDTATITLEEPLAPWMAAERAGTPMDWDELVREGRQRLQADGPLLVEGAGGLIVPLTEHCLVADLAAVLNLPLLIVARPKLGTVNHTLLTVEYARQRGLRVAGVIMNGYEDELDPMLKENQRMIETFGQVRVWGMLPWVGESPQTDAAWSAWRDLWVETVERRIDMQAVMEYF
ncbi:MULTISPECIES: dethiobiotin synthase [unclassified Paenibacillus]|uniref:dethiobiotin synthase n=1 Tax=unclassified Paenibacillus TaxID=185978 RepID=UPI001AE48DCA|nr:MULTISPECIES: dethiobiotin synthase [unclassified Paenibacillus]MBP1157518.1 dethiobiotin synthetase [Paenibacillus sp. PvP091]MBP1171745.1 dethiobiotin synthetase [Paenibacillus sp. PvR098]MBP2438126.1 dethiobiotin synthetase [Paenibacillus sp. PvP052]